MSDTGNGSESAKKCPSYPIKVFTVDSSGAAAPNIRVDFVDDEWKVRTCITNAKGYARIRLDEPQYDVYTSYLPDGAQFTTPFPDVPLSKDKVMTITEGDSYKLEDKSARPTVDTYLHTANGGAAVGRVHVDFIVRSTGQLYKTYITTTAGYAEPVLREDTYDVVAVDDSGVAFRRCDAQAMTDNTDLTVDKAAGCTLALPPTAPQTKAD